MATLADIRRAANRDVHTGTDDTTPDGTFYALAEVLGIATTYLLVGDPGDDNAPIVGRIEHQQQGSVAMVGHTIKGGMSLRRDEMTDSATAFRAMRRLTARSLIVHVDTVALNQRNREVQLPAGRYERVECQEPGMAYFVGPRGYVWHIAAAHNPRVSVI